MRFRSSASLVACPLLVLALLAAPMRSAHADEAVDAPAPSLELADDVEVAPYERFAVYLDAVGLFLDGYGLSLAYAPHRRLAVGATVYGRSGDAARLGAELAVSLHPQGRGLTGVFASASAGAEFARAPVGVSPRFHLEGGYQHVFGGVLLGASVGASFVRADTSLRATLRVGFAFR